MGIVSTVPGTITTSEKTYIGKTTISIKNGNLTGNGILTPVPPTTLTLSKSDIIVVPANQNATLSGAYVSTYSNITPNRGQVELTAANGNSTNELIFNIFAIKSY